MRGKFDRRFFPPVRDGETLIFLSVSRAGALILYEDGLFFRIFLFCAPLFRLVGNLRVREKESYDDSSGELEIDGIEEIGGAEGKILRWLREKERYWDTERVLREETREAVVNGSMDGCQE